MLQVKLQSAREIVKLEIPIPKVSEDQVLIRIERLGICGSDIQVYHGKHKYMTFPIVQGHECAGVIVRVGSRVRGLSPGDKATVQPQIFCGTCEPCRRGHSNVCEHLEVFGIHRDGMAAEYFAVDSSKVLKLPESVDFESGAMTEPVAVAAGTVRRCGDLTGQNVIVLGAGAIGNLTAQTALLSGAARVLLTDVNEIRLLTARLCGIKHCVNMREERLATAIARHFGEKGADLIIDCAAAPDALREAVEAARPASRIAIVGNYKEPVTLEMPLLQRRQIDLLGIMMYVREDFERAIRLIADRQICLEPLITHRFSLSEFKEVYEFIDAHPESVIKVMMKVGK